MLNKTQKSDICEIYARSNSRAYPYADAFEAAFAAAFEEGPWVKAVHYVEGLTEDWTDPQMAHRSAHLVSVDQYRSGSVGSIGVIEEGLRWDHCFVVVSSYHLGQRV